MGQCERCGKECPDEQLVAIPHYRICAACDAALGQKIVKGLPASPRGEDDDPFLSVFRSGTGGRADPAAVGRLSDINPPDVPATDGETADSVVYQGATFRAGDRIRVRLRAGTFKPRETGYPREVVVGAGRTGEVVCFVRRGNGPAFILARVRWDRQAWPVYRSGGTVALEPFEATIHVDYLEVIR